MDNKDQAIIKKPETTTEGIVVHPTSFIPMKSHVEPARVPKKIMSGLHIEVIHVIIFFLLTGVLFYSKWKTPDER